MQHLFLTSINITGFLPYIKRPAHELKVLYTDTAANPYEKKDFIDWDRNVLKEKNISYTEFNLANIPDNGAEKVLSDLFTDVDVLIVSGGNTFYLLQEVLRTRFDKLIKRKITEGMWYVGTSAGAVIAGSIIEPVKYMDNPEKAPDLKTFTGLELVDFVIVPHMGQERYGTRLKQIVQECEEKKYAFIAITDEESILVEGDKYRTIG